MKFVALIVLAALLAIVVSQNTPPTVPKCVAVNSDDPKNSINLGRLILSDSTNSNFYEQDGAYTSDEYHFNICGTVTSQYCQDSPDTAVCQITSKGASYSCGLLSQMEVVAVNSSQSVVKYGGGDVCPGVPGKPNRSSRITVNCDPSVQGTETVGAVIETACAYSLVLSSNQACPVKDNLPPVPPPNMSPYQCCVYFSQGEAEITCTNYDRCVQQVDYKLVSHYPVSDCSRCFSDS